MSLIKSHLSHFSSQPGQPRNISKLTNETIASINTSSLLKGNTKWNAKGFSYSKSFYKIAQGQQGLHQNERALQQFNNSMPNKSDQQINQLLQLASYIGFMSKQFNQRKILIVNKERTIKDLRLKISLHQDKLRMQMSSYKRKERNLRTRSLSLSRHKKVISERVASEIYDMKLGIDMMKRTIQSNRQSNYKRNDTISGQKQRKRVYIPILLPRHSQTSQRQSRVTEYLQTQPEQQYESRRRQVNTEQFHSHRQKDYSNSFWNQNNRLEQHSISMSKRISNSGKNSEKGTPQHKKNRGEASGGILQLIQDKLQKGQKLKGMGQFQRNPEVIQEKHIKQYEKISKDAVDLRIHTSKEPNLDYLCDENIEIRSSQKSKKSIKTLKSSRGLVTKWKKDQEDKQIVELLRKSINDKSKKQDHKKEERSAIGAKLIVTDCGQTQSLVNKSKEKANNSKQSEQRKQNNSGSSEAKITREQRQILINSLIGIDLQDISDSQDQQAKDSKSRPIGKSFNSTLKKQIKIQQSTDQKTPNNILYLQIPRIVFPTPPEKELQRPPSLQKPSNILEQKEDEFYDDDIDSIRLATTSKRVDFETPSKLMTKSQTNLNNEQQDFLGGIRLQTISKISRQRSQKSNLLQSSAAEQQFQQPLQPLSIIKNIDYSQLSQGMQDEDIMQMDQIDSQLRRSTNSIFVKKGNSSIQKSAPRSRNTNQYSRNSFPNKASSMLLMSKNGISDTIEEADEEEEQQSTIVKKFRKVAQAKKQ